METNTTHRILARNFTLLSENEQLMILERRNNPDVRKWMVHTDPISPEEHLRYCASLKNRLDMLQLLVEFDGTPACVLSFKASDNSWHELADSGIYAFDPTPCASSILSNIISCMLIIERGIKVCNTIVKNENEIAIFANQYYHNYHVIKKDDKFTFMSANTKEPSFYRELADRLLEQLHATIELKL